MATALVAAGIGLVGAVGGALINKSAASAAAKASTSMAVPRAAQLRPNSTVSDALMARRGSRVNNRTGPRGAEAPMGSKTKLGQ